jgi:hypothetical protein
MPAIQNPPIKSKELHCEILKQLDNHGGDLTFGELMFFVKKPYDLIKVAVDGLAREGRVKLEKDRLQTVRLKTSLLHRIF